MTRLLRLVRDIVLKGRAGGRLGQVARYLASVRIPAKGCSPTVSTFPLLLVLASAALHASWNLVVKGSDDRLVAGFGQALFGALVFSPLLFVYGLPTGVWPLVLLSGVIHVGYVVSLVAAYDQGDLSLVYPVARGLAPVWVTLAAIPLLDDSPTPIAVLAISLAVAGVLLVAKGAERRGLGWALLTSVMIAGYTLNDAAAVRSLDSAIAYTVTIFFGQSLLLIPVLLLRRSPSGVMSALRLEWRRHIFAGAASAGAYGLVLAAARLAPLGLVSAFRESSVIFGALGGWLILKEVAAKKRLGGAGLIALGLAVLVFAG